eukprot:gene1414-32787_t
MARGAQEDTAGLSGRGAWSDGRHNKGMRNLRGDLTAKYSALCTVAKNENQYLAEWLHYHKCLGIDKVYLYDHNSERPLALDVEEHVKSGFVEVQPFNGTHKKLGPKDGFADSLDRFSATIQGKAYKDCLERHSDKHAFMGFIDVDEFIVMHSAAMPSINKFLQQYAEYGGVSLYWMLLGSSGHKSRPVKSVVESYTKAGFTVTDGNNFLVDELRRPIQLGRNTNSTHQLASVYHYATKSEQDFKAKIKRGGGAGVTRPLHYLTNLDKRANWTCLGAILTLDRTCKAIKQ